MQKGTQIVYIPDHACGDIMHNDCDWGFVTSVHKDVAFCRYWSKMEVGALRTKSCSEATPICNLKEVKSVPREAIKSALAIIEMQHNITD